MLADGEQLGHQGLVAGHEPGAVAGQVGALGQRVQGQQTGQVAAGDRRVQDRDRLGVPAELAVALVGGDDRPLRPGPVDPAAQLGGVQDLPGRVGRRVEPDQGRSLVHGGRVVGSQDAAAGDPGTDLVRRVGHGREHDQVIGSQPQQGRQPGHQLLGADDGQRRGRGQPCRSPPRRQVGRYRLPQGAGTGGEGVAGTVGGPGQGLPAELRGRVDRGADREVDDPVRVLAGPGLGPGQRVPREVGQGRGQTPPRPSRGKALAHSAVSCGGNASISGWSLSTTPILAAPPGDPRSLKNSTLAL